MLEKANLQNDSEDQKRQEFQERMKRSNQNSKRILLIVFFATGILVLSLMITLYLLPSFENNRDTMLPFAILGAMLIIIGVLLLLFWKPDQVYDYEAYQAKMEKHHQIYTKVPTAHYLEIEQFKKRLEQLEKRLELLEKNQKKR